MAHLKDLIVSGVTKFIGKVYGTITNAIKDDKDQTISSTYIKNISGGGVNSLTITKGDGTSSNVKMNVTSDNATNADMLDGLHAEKFMRYEPDKSIVTSINDMITPGTYGVYSATPDFPTGYGSWGLLEVQVYGLIRYQIIKFETGIIINRAKIIDQTEWTTWQRVNDGGNADTVDGLHADDFFRKGSQVQFVPYNMKYYALNDKICLFSDNDDATRGIYFINNSSSSITVCVLVSATAEGPVCQYGYGANTYPEIQDTGINREWYTIESIPTSPVIYAMEVPPGKLGYFGFYFNSASAYTTVHDIRCPYFNFF